MCKIKHKVEEHMIWLVENGEVSFWYDNWTSLGPLCKYLGDEARPKDIKLRDVFVNGEWNENNTGLTWPEFLKNIVQNMDLALCPDKLDKPIWVPDRRGTFTTSSAWNIFRQRRGPSTTDTRIWHKSVPFKMAFLTWRAIHDRLSTGERGYSLVTTTSLLVEPQSFEYSSFFYSQVIAANNFVKIVEVKKFGQLQMETTWEKLQRIVNQPITHRIYKVVKWSRPPPFYYKFNSDGSCVEGACGASRVIRECNGTLVMVYSVYLGQGTSNWAEGHAMLLGLQHYISRGLDKIIVEADSKVLVSAINEESSTPWRLLQIVDKIKQIVSEKGAAVKHCYREANKVADKLASISHLHKQAITGLPRQIRGLHQLDRWEMASFRIRQRKTSKIYFEPP
ncbi:uncharacterized protein LOC142172040 [Nicotiana tabacum]|uniref:Uncharacterized protein LOC142172040 n=1 Tax=Nicotiana tabacum TaxID=4097 RepID=A0AC58T409_TOBAC